MKKSSRCIFCIGRSPKADAKRYIISRSAHAFSLLNRYPYNSGHVMIAPYRHEKDISRLEGAELTDMIELLIETKKVLDKKLKPHGYNVGINLGTMAGAGFDAHVHIHIVPRWKGDTNFMPVTARSRVVPDSLEAMYRLLRKA